MGLHINDPEADQLARELAELTGDTLENAVTEALRERLEKQRKVVRVLAEVKEIQRRVAALPVLDSRTPEEIIGYDENGLPA
jgi:antitoxin VapB